MTAPLPAGEWDFFKAAHLSRRAGFGDPPSLIQRLVNAGPTRSVQFFLDAATGPSDAEYPEWFNPETPRKEFEHLKQVRKAAPENRMELNKALIRDQREQMVEARQWWLRRMASTPFPLREKMTLFWHGHFATSHKKVRSTYSMMLQNRLFRDHALGNFGDLVKAVSRDPAMMQYLDTQQSNKKQPNENFARELMELFTLGEGHYSEEDIRESARAFTGYRIQPQTRAFSFNKLLHDPEEKTFLGKTGRFDGNDIIDIILEQKQCARFIAGKAWAFFAYENPDDKLVDSLADAFRSSGHSLRELMRSILANREFYSPRAMHTQIKGPVQWMVEASRELEFPMHARPPMQRVLGELGQQLFDPPNVKGWDGGKSWISTSSLLMRYNLASFLVNGLSGFQPPGAGKIYQGLPAPVDLHKIAPPNLRNQPAPQVVDSLSRHTHLAPLDDNERTEFIEYLESRDDRTSDASLSGLLQLMLSTPSYQLC